jgi:TolA-binding protein
MNRPFLSIILSLLSISVFSQPNFNVSDPERSFKEAKEFFLKEQYSLSYPLLREIKHEHSNETRARRTYLMQDVDYYYVVSGLKLNLPVAEAEAKTFVELANNEPRQQMMSYHLAKYYFVKNDYENAITFYERAGYSNLSNEEIADAKFEKAYSHFNLKQFSDAKPLFNEIHQLPKNRYYIPANYYYGLISYRDRQFAEAMKAFKVVETQEEYRGVVPYYITEIYYFQGKKDEALRYGEEILSKGGQYYEKDLNLLIGQIYFERKNFARALPLLEAYVNSSEKVSKEIMYELSYCYYQANQLTKAIEGFKQLSNERDSLGQNSMYLLGDCYLKTGQKANARVAFQYCALNSSNKQQQEISRFNYAKLSYELGYPDIALTEMQKFLENNPRSPYETEAREILVALLANSNDYSGALALYESFDKPTPSMQKLYPKILYGRATEYFNDGELERADDMFNRVTKNQYAGNYNHFAQFWRGEIAYRKGDYDGAVRMLTSYLENGGFQGEANPNNAKYVLGYAYLKKENYRQALANFEQLGRNVSASSTPIVQDAFLRTADAHFMLRDYARARAMYDAILNAALPQSDYAMYQKAVIAGITNPGEKVRILNTLSSQYPSSELVTDANMEIANTYMAEEKFRDAIPYLNKVLATPRASSEHPRALLKLGLSHYNLNNNTEALANYQRLVKQYPASPEADEALENLKNVYVEEGRPNEYVDFVRSTGKNISVSEADSLTYNAAELKYTNGDCTGAIAGFSNYLSKYPTGSFALQAYFLRSECYLKSKDFSKAVEGYEAVMQGGASRYAERAALQASRLYYFELKDYVKAKNAFVRLREIASTQENQMEALRGLVRSYYQLKDYAEANTAAKDLLTRKGLSTDDKAIANLVLGKSAQVNNKLDEALTAFKAVAAVNKSAWGAEARYEIANIYFAQNNLSAAEKAGMEVIRVTASYDYWVAKAYILLGDIYMQQKDYFNAKATYQSVADNVTIPELKVEAQNKLVKAVEAEKAASKVQ